MSQYQLRQASLEELPQVLELLQLAAQRLQAKGLRQWHYWLDLPTEKVAWVRTGLEQGEFYLLAEAGSIAAMFRLQESDPSHWGVQSQAAYYIHSLVVHPAWAGRQLGQKILASIAHFSRAMGVERLRLDCDAQNHQLGAYYEQLGFQRVGQVEQPLSTNNLYEKILTLNPGQTRAKTYPAPALEWQDDLAFS